MDYESLYNYYKAFGLSDEEARKRANRQLGRVDEPVAEQGDGGVGFFGGLSKGARETAESYVGGLGKLFGSRGAQDLAERIGGEDVELTGAGRAGRAIGRIGTELAGLVGGGGLALKGVTKLPAVGSKIASALGSASRTQRGLATAAASLPIDYLQAAAYEEGAVLPGVTGAFAENVALSGLAGSLLRPASRAARALDEVDQLRLPPGREPLALQPGQYEMGAASPITRPERLLSERAGRTRRVATPEGAVADEVGLLERRRYGPETLMESRGPLVTPGRIGPERQLPASIPFRMGPATAGEVAEEAVGAAPRLQGDQYTLFSGVPITSLDRLLSEGAGAAMGAGLGAAVGGVASEESPAAGILGGALVGAGLGYGGFKAFAKAANNVSSTPDQLQRSVQENVLRTARSPLEAGAGVAGARKPVPSVAKLVPEDVSREFTERGLGTRRRSLSDIDEAARGVDINDVYTKFRAGRKLESEELVAVRNELDRLTEQNTSLTAAAAKYGAEGNVAALNGVEEELFLITERMLPLEQIANNLVSESGLTLKIAQTFLSRIAKAAPDGGKRWHMRQQVMNTLGVKRLRPDLENQMEEILSIADENKVVEGLANFILKNSKSKRSDIALDWRRAGLLSRPASWIRNTAGSAENMTADFIESPIANAFDRIFAKATGQERVFGDFTIAQRSSALLEGARKGVKDVWDNRRAYLSGIDPEEVQAVLSRRPVNYEQFFGEGAPEAVKSGLRAFQKANNIIYGIIAGGDKPFYEAAYNASIKERGLLRALSSSAVKTGDVQVGTKQFDDLVRRFISKDTANVEDRVFATFDALDATYKTSNFLSQGLRRLKQKGGPMGTIADIVIPFANTPTNIVLKALERVPGFGIAFGSRYRGAIERHVRSMKAQGLDGVSTQAVENQLRRMYSKLAAKQITGAGMISAGYLLHQNGLITAPYTPPIGATDAEREAALRRNLTGEGALGIKIGDKTYDIAATLGTIAPLLAMGAAWSAAEQDVEGQPLFASSISQLGAAGGAIGETILTLPLLSGAQDVVETLRGRGMARPASLGRQAGTFVPFSAAVGGITRELDRDVGSRKPETFIEGATMNIPGLSRAVAPKVTSLGETMPASTPFLSYFNPFTERRMVSGQLYDVLGDIGWSPTAPRKLEGESEVEYSARRQQEGEIERQRLNAIIDSMAQSGTINLETLASDDAQKERLLRVLKRSLQRTRTRASRRRGTARPEDEI